MRPIVLLAPGAFEARTGGSLYNRRIVEGLRARGWRVDVRELDASFPRPIPAALADARAAVDATSSEAVLLVDSLALGAMPDVVEYAAARVPVVALMHLPLAAHPDLPGGETDAVAAAERRALAVTTRVVVTGDAGRELLSSHELPAGRLVTIEPGTDAAPRARGSRDGQVHLLSVATVNAVKGHATLLMALAAIAALPWRLTCAGSLTRDAVTAVDVQRRARDLGLADRVSFVGELGQDTLSAAYDGADAFVLASRLETYGMAVAEALARGLPVVSTRTGATASLVGDRAGLLVEVDDVEGLRDALARVISDGNLRRQLAAGARAAGARLPSWDDACAAFARLVEEVAPRG